MEVTASDEVELILQFRSLKKHGHGRFLVEVRDKETIIMEKTERTLMR
jgi:hypothetical protein